MLHQKTRDKITKTIDAIFYSEEFGITHQRCIRDAEKLFSKLNPLGIEFYQHYMEYKLTCMSSEVPVVICDGDICHALTGEVLIERKEMIELTF